MAKGYVLSIQLPPVPGAQEVKLREKFLEKKLRSSCVHIRLVGKSGETFLWQMLQVNKPIF